MHGPVVLVCHPLQLLRGLCALVGRLLPWRVSLSGGNQDGSSSRQCGLCEGGV